MSPERAGIILCCFMLVVCIVSCICVHEDRKKRRGLPDPQPDPRDYSGAFMRDFKQSTTRRI